MTFNVFITLPHRAGGLHSSGAGSPPRVPTPRRARPLLRGSLLGDIAVPARLCPLKSENKGRPWEDPSLPDLTHKNGEQGATERGYPPEECQASQLSVAVVRLGEQYLEVQVLICRMEVPQMICLRFVQEPRLCAFWKRGGSVISMPIL